MREQAAITRKNQSLDSVSWNILGQVYTPKQMTDDSFSWHATFPEESFVPPHVHPHQDEYIYVLEGRIDLILDGKTTSASVGDRCAGAGLVLGRPGWQAGGALPPHSQHVQPGRGGEGGAGIRRGVYATHLVCRLIRFFITF